MNLQRHKAIVLSYYPLSYYYPGLKDDLASVCTSWTVTAEAHQRLGIILACVLKGDPFLELHVFLRTLLVPSALEQDHQKRILDGDTWENP